MPDDEESLREELERLRRENEELKKKRAASLELKVGQKGAVSLYGLQRFPVTFYRDEWIRILEHGRRDPRLHRRYTIQSYRAAREP